MNFDNVSYTHFFCLLVRPKLFFDNQKDSEGRDMFYGFLNSGRGPRLMELEESRGTGSWRNPGELSATRAAGLFGIH